MFSKLGEKLIRTDIWVFLITIFSVVSFALHVWCVLKGCTEAVSYNQNFLIACLSVMAVDLGIKRWKR